MAATTGSAPDDFVVAPWFELGLVAYRFLSEINAEYQPACLYCRIYIIHCTAILVTRLAVLARINDCMVVTEAGVVCAGAGVWVSKCEMKQVKAKDLKDCKSFY